MKSNINLETMPTRLEVISSVVPTQSRRPVKELSPREMEIVDLCIEGLTNEGIAHRLNLSIGTVNTYWARIKIKVGGYGRADTIAKLMLHEASSERQKLDEAISSKDVAIWEHKAAVNLLHMAVDRNTSTVWATDLDLKIRIIANAELLESRAGVCCVAGQTVYKIFRSEDLRQPAISAHLGALEGSESEVDLDGAFVKMHLKVAPLLDDAGAVIGCLSILTTTP